MYSVYAIHSASKKHLYIGMTTNVANRLKQHSVQYRSGKSVINDKHGSELGELCIEVIAVFDNKHDAILFEKETIAKHQYSVSNKGDNPLYVRTRNSDNPPLLDEVSLLYESKTKPILEDLEKQRNFIGVTVRELCAHVGVTPRTFNEWRKTGTSLKRIHQVRQSLKHFASKYK